MSVNVNILYSLFKTKNHLSLLFLIRCKLVIFIIRTKCFHYVLSYSYNIFFPAVSANDKEMSRLVNEEKEMYIDRLKTVEHDVRNTVFIFTVKLMMLDFP